MIRDRSTARANFAGIAANPGASTRITCGMKISPRMVSRPSQKIITANASSAKRPRRRRPLGGEQAREGGHEGGVERALAEQAAEQIGQFQRDKERIRHRPDAQESRDQHVARETERAAEPGSSRRQ